MSLPADHSARTKVMIAGLKQHLGDRFKQFKHKSLAFQRGEVPAEAYYRETIALISDEQLVEEVIALLPDQARQTEVATIHSQQLEQRRVLASPSVPHSSVPPQAQPRSQHPPHHYQPDPPLRPAPNSQHSQQQRPGPSKGLGSGRGRKRQTTAVLLQPGLVHLKNALDLDTQRYLVQECFRLGEGSENGGGFYEELKDSKGGAPVMRLNMGTRGRVVDTIDSFPARFRDVCLQCLAEAQGVEGNQLPDMDPTTLLINWYKEGAEFKWHKDSEDPVLVRAGTGKTIISFTIGLSADFGYKHSFEDTTHGTVRLESGDVLLFGGPSRMIVHSVLRVIPKTMPPVLRGQMRMGRLNVTFRDVGCGFIDPNAYPRYRVSYDTETR